MIIILFRWWLRTWLRDKWMDKQTDLLWQWLRYRHVIRLILVFSRFTRKPSTFVNSRWWKHLFSVRWCVRWLLRKSVVRIKQDWKEEDESGGCVLRSKSGSLNITIKCDRLEMTVEGPPATNDDDDDAYENNDTKQSTRKTHTDTPKPNNNAKTTRKQSDAYEK